MVHVDVRIDDGFETKFGPEDDTCETQAADGGTEKFAVLVGRADEPLAVRA